MQPDRLSRPNCATIVGVRKLISCQAGRPRRFLVSAARCHHPTGHQLNFSTRPNGFSNRVFVTDSTTPKLRSFPDRLRQIALFELGGLLIMTPPFVWASGVPFADSIAMLALLSLIAAIWNGTYNTCFDWVDGRLSGRTADRRPVRLRVFHAIGFELGLLTVSLPVIMWWTGMSFIEALVADIALALAYTAYAFFFNLGYDRIFPIAPVAPQGGPENTREAHESD